MTNKQWRSGLGWASLSAALLGGIPIIAKIAYQFGMDPFTVAALRTLVAAALLWAGIALYNRSFIFSSQTGIVGSMIAGGINGLGSLFFYASLTRIDASLGQLINVTYLIFVTVLLRIIGQRVSIFTLLRIGVAIGAVYLLSIGGRIEPDWIGVALMLAGAFGFAVQLVWSQQIMYDIPAPTLTLYAMSGMALVVGVAWLGVRPDLSLIASGGWEAVIWMGVVTALSRLTLFLGVERLGSMQTALIGVGEVLVTILLAMAFLGEQLTAVQWLGAILLISAILFVRFETNVPTFRWTQLLIRWIKR